jgi:hypothetical protein
MAIESQEMKSRFAEVNTDRSDERDVSKLVSQIIPPRQLTHYSRYRSLSQVEIASGIARSQQLSGFKGKALVFYQIDLRQRPLVDDAMTDSPSLWRVLEWPKKR